MGLLSRSLKGACDYSGGGSSVTCATRSGDSVIGGNMVGSLATSCGVARGATKGDCTIGSGTGMS